MMNTAFDLTTEPWLPVKKSGKLVQVGLSEALVTAQEVLPP